MKKLLVVAALVAACGGGKNVRPGGEVPAPDWVAQNTGAFVVEGSKQLHGVGSATAPDAKSRRQQADAAAAQQLDGGIVYLAGQLAKMSEQTQDNLGDAISAIAKKAAAQSAAIRDHWVTPDGTEQALDLLDLTAFKVALQSVDGDDKLKREMAANVDKVFDSMVAH